MKRSKLKRYLDETGGKPPTDYSKLAVFGAGAGICLFVAALLHFGGGAGAVGVLLIGAAWGGLGLFIAIADYESRAITDEKGRSSWHPVIMIVGAVLACIIGLICAGALRWLPQVF